jgi:hypothetical protein
MEGDEWVMIDTNDVPRIKPPDDDVTLKHACQQTDKLVKNLLAVLNLLQDAKKRNDISMIRNLLPQCHKIIEKLRDKYIPVMMYSSYDCNESTNLISKPVSQLAVSGSVGITTGTTMWAIAPQFGIISALTAGTAGTILCAILLAQTAKNLTSYYKQKQTEYSSEIKTKLKALEYAVPEWPHDLTIHNIEEWKTKLTSYLQEIGLKEE